MCVIAAATWSCLHYFQEKWSTAQDVTKQEPDLQERVKGERGNGDFFSLQKTVCSNACAAHLCTSSVCYAILIHTSI